MTKEQLAQFENQAAEAKTLYLAKKYADAAGLYQTVYNGTQNVNMLWNTARCWEALASTEYEAKKYDAGDTAANKAIIAFTSCSTKTIGALQQDCLKAIDANKFVMQLMAEERNLPPPKVKTEDSSSSTPFLLISGAALVALLAFTATRKGRKG